MELSPEIVLLLFLVSTAAGWVDAIAGGGGLITLPTLILVGLPPAAALATNKLQGSIGSLTASIYFLRKGAVSINKIRLLIVFTFWGSIFGSWLVSKINPKDLIIYLPIFLVLMGLYFLFSPDIGNVDKKQKLTLLLFGLLVCPILGFYDGFFGPGTGSFMALSFVFFCGYSISKATANAKILNFTSNLSSLIYFVIFGQVYWRVGLIMIAGQFIGATYGAKMVLDRGVSIIKPVIVSVCFLMSIRILLMHL